MALNRTPRLHRASAGIEIKTHLVIRVVEEPDQKQILDKLASADLGDGGLDAGDEHLALHLHGRKFETAQPDGSLSFRHRTFEFRRETGW